MLLSLQTFGPYELDELLGRGRTGEVHRAWDTHRHRTVALRIVAPGPSADPRFRARFLRDWRLAARLDEPHVVPVHEVGEFDGRLFVDTELVDGRDLAAVLAAEGPLPADRAVDVVGQVAAALDAAHAHRLVHGDVRPGTVLLSGHSARPHCHLVGFGTGGDGSPGYVAPERLSGRPADSRADVYSLACLLRELLTGAPPGSAGPVPPALAAVVARGTAEDPDRRPPSAGDLARAARTAIAPAPATVPLRKPAATPVPAGTVRGRSAPGADRGRHRSAAAARPGPRPGRRRGLAAALLAGALALAGAGGVAATQLTSDASDTRAPTPVAVESVDDPGRDPFVPTPGQSPPGTPAAASGTDDPAQGSAGTTAGTDDPSSGGTAPPSGAQAPSAGTDDPGPGAGTPAAAPGGAVTGDLPGLYGGGGEEVCDAAGMAAFLAEHPDRGAAWAGVEDVPTEGIDDYLATLTPVVLRFDTAVTNHGVADGRATPFQSVLQAGTAVLVDDAGVPQVRCVCGNPLGPPAPRSSPEYQGDPWPGFAPDTVVVVESSPAPVPAFVLVDDATGAVATRPVGTAGDVDRVADPALAERARVLGMQPAPPPPGTGTTSAGPSVADPPDAGPPGDDPTGGSPTGDGPAPAGRSGGSGGSGGSSAPDPGPGTGGTSGGDPPRRDSGEQPADPPADDGPAGDGPVDETPAQDTPAQDTPAQDTAGEDAPTQQTPAQDTAGEDAPTQQTPTQETSTQDTPTADTPTADTPTEDTDATPADEAPTTEEAPSTP
ncbi:DUF6777 domain-containing protein [Geodermatophilus sp. URMC 62]|uniref:DUF6777 domain-containing protein n=1 Tax=Geodermatophilus sp. URMC 62 TaxID=3423414 RepID=UPI00406CCC9E